HPGLRGLRGRPVRQVSRRALPRALKTSRRDRGRKDPGSTLQVAFLDRQRHLSVGKERMLRVLRGAARELGVSGEVGLVFTGDGPVRKLNARYRGKDEPTDVLSFPGGGAAGELGDVVISV